ncbi:hypothetical protein EUX98_g2926 [Antrodiella citrinella]|uniref:Uncharacterized protein n=1 Tax=Antrodiella citrinella TaxID=2447956 RepID=A0A4S4MXT9_9APHY|nr:hypothetical protein EUX98_g2926 [Antrodiella citrinella]
MAATDLPPSPTVSGKRSHPSLPELDIPPYRPQFVTTLADTDSPPCEGPPSPTATEIIDVEGADFTRTAEQHGVKVRDFALKSADELDDACLTGGSVKEYWNPTSALLRHDVHIRRPINMGPYVGLGKNLHRLLDSGWVVMEEAERHWTKEDWAAVKAYRSQPGGPYPYTLGRQRRPTAAFRTAQRKSAYPTAVLIVPDESIFMPKDEPGMWDGGDVTDEVEDGEETDTSDKNAKRRKISDEDTAHLGSRFMAPVSASSAPSAPTVTAPAPIPSVSRKTSHAIAPSSNKRTLRRTNTLVRVQ